MKYCGAKNRGVQHISTIQSHKFAMGLTRTLSFEQLTDRNDCIVIQFVAFYNLPPNVIIIILTLKHIRIINAIS
jgi:hypothetical protein